jgi:LysR family transcriptional regulator, hypochlorite-specific transcription factor HypT
VGRRPRAGRRARIAAAVDRSGGDSSGHPFITYSEDWSFGRVLVHNLTTKAGLKPVFTSHHAGVLKVMALGGQGVAWLPRSLILAELGRRDLVPVGDQARKTIAL